MKLNAQFTFRDTLKQALNDKARVSVHLQNGQSFSGYVGDVAEHHVVIARLTGKEFYDAVIRIEEIAAIESRARES